MVDTEHAQAEVIQTAHTENTTEGAIKYRLDTADIIAEMEITLKGYRVTYNVDKKGNVVPQIEKVSEPMMNGEGIHWLIGYMKNMFNAHFFQGNIKEDIFFSFLERARLNTAKILMRNLYVYDIKPHNFRPIQELIHRGMIGWASRPVGDKEREHLTPSFRRVENVSSGQRSTGGFNMMGDKSS